MRCPSAPLCLMMRRQTAMSQMKNVWVDGSLRDSKWYEQVFEDIRKVFAVSRLCGARLLWIGSTVHVALGLAGFDA